MSRTGGRASWATAALFAGLIVLVHERGRAAGRRSGNGSLKQEDESHADEASDRSELRRAKEAAEAANEAKTRYLVSVSHEIRSPLNAIYGYAQLLERGGSVSASEAGAVIRRSAEHLTNLVEGLLEMSRIESGVMTIRSDVVDVGALLEHVVDMFHVQAAAKGISLDLTTGPLPPRVRTDEKRLRQILINLVSNAIKYTRTGSVKVIVGYRSQVMDLEVRDTGIGIAPDELDRVFDPFVRGGSPDVQRETGVGLGLAITRMLAHILGGDIAVVSTPGSGSSFRLKLMLPAAAPERNDAWRVGRADGYRGVRRSVLIVDDDPVQSAILQSFLRPLGFTVDAAANGAAGTALVARHAPDIALLDVEMPGISGWQTAEALRAAHGDAIKIVMVSANAPEFHIAPVGGRPHDAFVMKPVDLDALLDVIGDQLGLRFERQAIGPVDRQETSAPAHLPAEAVAGFDHIRHLATVGHVQGIEQALQDMEETAPDAADLVATLRNRLNACDLRSLVQVLDDAEAC